MEYKREIANVGNRERIIESTIELMNKSGSSVGTTQLINHLGISPGNLYSISAIGSRFWKKCCDACRMTLTMC